MPTPGRGPATPDSDLESVPPGEAEQIAEIVAIHLSVTDPSERPHVPRGQHMKGHGCVRAEFTVLPDLPQGLRHGIFASPRKFDALIRYSNGKGQDDRQPDAHGMAIKLLGVEGEKMLEAERNATTQDFVLIDNPVFFIRNVADYVPFMKDFRNLRAPGMSPGKALAIAKLFLSWDYKWRLLRATGSKKPDSPFRISYWSTTPSKLGDSAVKYMASPDIAGVPAPQPVDSPDKLRLAMASQLATSEACFDFLVQRGIDPVAMPVEDPTVAWDGPWTKVARIRIPPQTFDTPEQMKFCEDLSFTPWHTLPAHRPLGGINRSRKAIYQAISNQRHELNGTPHVEPV
jgi:Catalase